MKFNTICELVDNASTTYGRKTLYKTEANTISYNKINSYIDKYALYLNSLKKEKIGILSENRFEWEIAFFAILKSGNIVVPIDKSLTQEEINNIASRVDMKYVFTSKKYLDKAKVISNTLVFEELEKDSKIEKLNFSKVKPEDIAVICFTSGTTSDSKAVELTHKNICANIHGVEKIYDLSLDDTCLAAMPLSHVLEGLFNMLNCLNVGASRAHVNDVDNIIDALGKYKVTYMGAVPAVLDYLLNYEDELKHIAKRINMFMCGGAKLNVETVNSYAALGIKVIQGYGLTECSPVVSLETDKYHKLGSVGKPIPGVEVTIRNLDEDGIGQIVLKGDSIGNYLDKKSNESTLQTGDLGYIDDEGYLFISGRQQDMIVLSNGKKVFPEEIETLLNKIDLVNESLVYDNNGKLSAIIVTDRLNNKLKIEEKVKRVNRLLPTFKRIQNVDVRVEALEKTTLGKLKRNIEIKEKEESSKKENSKEAKILEIVKSQIKKDNIKLDDRLLEDLGADSLDIATILCKVQKEFDIKFTREQKSDIKTIKDIIKGVK